MPVPVHALAIVNDLFDEALDGDLLDVMAEADLLDEAPAPEEDKAPPIVVH